MFVVGWCVLFAVCCLLIVVCCALLAVCCLLLVGRRAWFVVCLFADFCLVFVVCLFVVNCLLFVAWRMFCCLLLVACGLLRLGCCLLLVVC